MNVLRRVLPLLVACSSAAAFGQADPNAGRGTGGQAASGTGAAASAKNAEKIEASRAGRENSKSSMASASQSAGAHQDGIVMRGGTVYFYKNGQSQKVENELRLSEGITADHRGHVTLKDGRKLTLKDGQMVTLDGEVVTPQGSRVDKRTSGAATWTATGERDIGAGSAGSGASDPDVTFHPGSAASKSKTTSDGETSGSGAKPQNQQR